MENIESKFLGIGWKFPPSFSHNAQQVEMVKDVENVHNSLEVLLATLPGERIMQQSYGCSLQDFLYEPMTTALITRMTDRIERAIITFEPRVRVLRVSIDNLVVEEGKVDIHVHYEIKSTNSRYNLVYPFYIEEGRIQP